MSNVEPLDHFKYILHTALPHCNIHTVYTYSTYHGLYVYMSGIQVV